MRDTKTFNYSVDLAPGAFSYYDFANVAEVDDLGDFTQKYVPFKNISIVNTGSETIRFYENDARNFIVIPSGVIYELKNRDIYRMKFENVGAVNNAVFTFSINNEITTDERVEMLLKRY